MDSQKDIDYIDITNKKQTTAKNITFTNMQNNNSNFFSILGIFLIIYFILYFVISLFVSLETLFLIFNTFDFIFIIIVIFQFVFKMSMSLLDTIKYIWTTIKPFFIDPSYLLYLVIFMLILQIPLYIFKNKFDISKPIILSIIEGFLYIFFIIILIDDVLQLAFKIPLINILENDINRQYNLFPWITNNTSNNINTSNKNCLNINNYKDPVAIRSFYDLQINNYQKMKDQYYKITNASSKNSDTTDTTDNKNKNSNKYQNNIDNPFIDGTPNKNDSSTNMPKSQFDNNINTTLKYWMDNSSNIIKSKNNMPF